MGFPETVLYKHKIRADQKKAQKKDLDRKNDVEKKTDVLKSERYDKTLVLDTVFGHDLGKE